MKVKKITSNYDYDDSAYTYFGIDFSNVIDGPRTLRKSYFIKLLKDKISEYYETKNEDVLEDIYSFINMISSDDIE